LPSHLERNLTLYPWFAVLLNAHFWLPAFFLYFQSRVSLQEVLLLEAIYYASISLLEIPSGYFSDAIGRRPTLIIAAAALALAYALFFVSSTFAGLAVAQALLALGLAFRSGTDEALHYDTLSALGRKGEFAGREAVIASWTFRGAAGAAVLGGAVAAWRLEAPYALSFVGAVATLGVAIAFREPDVEGRRQAAGFVAHLRECRARLGHSARLRWLFAFAVAAVVLNHIPYEFYQPYLERLTASIGAAVERTPLATGLHAAATMLIASGFAARSVKIRDRLGLFASLFLAAGLQACIIGAMALGAGLVGGALTLLRSVPRGLATAPLNAAVNDELPSSHRATYLSIQSLAGRLAFSGVLASLSGVAALWDGDSRLLSLRASAVLAVLILLALGLTSSPVRTARAAA